MMIKSILLPAAGDMFDEAVLETALHVAQLAPAHIEVGYLRELEQQSERARECFAEICRRKGVSLIQAGGRSTSMTASWHELGDGGASLAYYARHADMIVMGRGLGRSHLEMVLAASGRPVLIAPASPPASIADTVFICWKESPEAARALAAALPLLAAADRVIIATVAEDGARSKMPLQAVAHYLSRHGIAAETRLLPCRAAVAETLAAAADAHQADLIVLGAYGHSWARESVLGGCTRSFLDSARLPVLMMQ
jgi:nucleotide-binding universal stress UspA family protein